MKSKILSKIKEVKLLTKSESKTISGGYSPSGLCGSVPVCAFRISATHKRCYPNHYYVIYRGYTQGQSGIVDCY